MKIALITVNTDNFDDVMPIPKQSVDFDFHCFTENNLPKFEMSKRLLSKYPKLMTHCLLPDYDIYVWIDGSIEITSEFFIEEIIKDLRDVKMAKHPERQTIGDEFNFVLDQMHVDNPYLLERYNIKNIVKESLFINDGNLPLYACGIFARRNSPEVNRAFEKIWGWCQIYGNFDQPLYSLAEKNGIKFDTFYSFPSEWYNVRHHKQKPALPVAQERKEQWWTEFEQFPGKKFYFITACKDTEYLKQNLLKSPIFLKYPLLRVEKYTNVPNAYNQLNGEKGIKIFLNPALLLPEEFEEKLFAAIRIVTEIDPYWAVITAGTQTIKDDIIITKENWIFDEEIPSVCLYVAADLCMQAKAFGMRNYIIDLPYVVTCKYTAEGLLESFDYLLKKWGKMLLTSSGIIITEEK